MGLSSRAYNRSVGTFHNFFFLEKKEIAKPIQEQEVRQIEEPIKTSLLQEVQVQGRSQQIPTPLCVEGKEEVQVRVRPQQVKTPFRIQGQEEIQIQVRPQQVKTPFRQAQVLGDAKAQGEKSGIDQREISRRGHKGRLKKKSMREGAGDTGEFR